MIDANLRTLPDRDNTLIAGSSMGGLMSLYAATAFNSVFGKAACLSPSLWLGAGKAVSYTHLDVYKRQVSQMQIRDEHHAQAFAPAAILGDLGVIAFHGQLGRVMNAQNAG